MSENQNEMTQELWDSLVTEKLKIQANHGAKPLYESLKKDLKAGKFSFQSLFVSRRENNNGARMGTPQGTCMTNSKANGWYYTTFLTK